MKLKVMSFNLRYSNASDGINCFENRKGRITEVIEREAPDLIGFQEVTDDMRSFLRSSLSHSHCLLGCGRERDHHGEACCIAIRHGMLEVVNFETRFLSDTPLLAGSIYEGSDQSPCPRLYVHAELVGEGGARLHFYNTHLDHRGETARLRAMHQILASVVACDAPFVLTGDMNALPDSPEARLPLACKERGICDATAAISHTFHDFGRRTEPCKIDYIYTDIAYHDSYAVIDAPKEGVFPSDHYPVCTILDV